jgi:hypothetical protein
MLKTQWTNVTATTTTATNFELNFQEVDAEKEVVATVEVVEDEIATAAAIVETEAEVVALAEADLVTEVADADKHAGHNTAFL